MTERSVEESQGESRSEESQAGWVLASAKAWTLTFGSVALTTPVLFVVLGDPTPGVAALYLTVYLVLTAASVMLAFPRDPAPKEILTIALLSVAYYVIAALPGSFVGGVLVGLIGRVFA